MAINLNYTWKKSFDPQQPTPFAMLCTFYDLICYWDTTIQQEVCRFNTQTTSATYKMKGYELPHNIIKFDENMYQEDTSGVGHRIIVPNLGSSPAAGQTTFEDFTLYGIDVSMPRFDNRSKPLFLAPYNVDKYIPGIDSTTFDSWLSAVGAPNLNPSDFYYGLGPGIKVWDKNAIMRPVTSYDFYTHSPNYTRVPDVGIADTWQDYTSDDAFYIAVESDGSAKINNCDICLTNMDVSFQYRFLGGASDGSVNDGIYAYNGLCFNYESDRVWNIIKRQYGFTKDLSSPISFSNLIGTINPIWKFIMQNTYVFVKASFFADYIDYKDFDQNLNKTSSVLHSNMLVSPTGDLARYNTAYSSGQLSATDLAKNTRPYISKITPSIDLVGPLTLPSGSYIDDPSNVAVQVNTTQKIIDDGNGPNSKIGALNVEPFEWYDPDLDDGVTSTAQTPPPPVYFDPESRKPANSYNDIPIVVPKDGNVQISGRFIGPTIDEIWQEIKMLIAGRIPDVDSTGTTPVPRPDGGYPTGTKLSNKDYRINTDSRPKIKNHKIPTNIGLTNTPSIGDPVDITYNFDDPKNALYSVVKWVNNPNTISYKALMEIDSLNDLLCQAIMQGGTKTWKKISAELYHLTAPDKVADTTVKNRYNPSDSPLSLRELEGIVKGLQWNLSYLLSFMIRNNTWAGSVGYYNNDVLGNLLPGDVEGGDYYRESTVSYIGHAYNVNDGSAYQLHKDYNGDYSNANTRYDQRANNGSYNASTNPYGMPPGVQGTGLAALEDRQVPDRQDIVPSYAVFLAADGKWHAPGYQFLQMPIYSKAEETW